MAPSQPKTLCIVSRDRHTEQSAPLDLEYDLRDVPNPPRSTRRLHTGLSKSLREQLLEHPQFRAKLEQAESEIKSAMTERRAWVAEQSQPSDETEDAAPSNNGDAEDPFLLRVGCLCGSGHHRSEAFAEELARRDWPSDWNVELRHRDLPRRVRDQKRKARQRAAA